jgi:hypothetical protein
MTAGVGTAPACVVTASNVTANAVTTGVAVPSSDADGAANGPNTIDCGPVVDGTL